MSYAARISISRLAAATVCLSIVALPIFAADATPGPVTGSWQPHKDSFNFFGITTFYSCSSIEDRVKEILVHFGARKDASVHASGCPNGTITPGRTAYVRAEFYTLAPSEGASSPSDANAQWTSLELSPRHPFFMGDGDCELIQQMKDFLSKNFSLRDLQYTTSCVPHDVTLNGFSVKAQVLKPVPPAKASALSHG